MKTGALILLLTSLMIPGAFAAECLTSSSVPAILLIATTGPVSLDGDRLPQVNVKERKLICVRYDRNRKLSAIEYVNLLGGNPEVVSFKELAASGHKTHRTVPVFNEVLVAHTTCVDCRPDASQVKLRLGMLHTFKLGRKSEWIYPEITISLATQPPAVDYKGTPFNIITLRAEEGLGGGVKRVRLSLCDDEKNTTCLKSANPRVRHMTFTGR